MSSEDIEKRIADRLLADNFPLSQSDIDMLLEATIRSIDNSLNTNGEVEIGDFGVFQRKKSESTSYTSFKPTENLKERIKQVT